MQNYNTGWFIYEDKIFKDFMDIHRTLETIFLEIVQLPSLIAYWLLILKSLSTKFFIERKFLAISEFFMFL